jgi:hypothetical protein
LGASSTYSGGIQRLETSGVKEQEESKEEQNKELVQTKLTVGAPGDKYEQEADSMAAKVMRMPDSAIKPPIQRQTGEKIEAVQMQPLVNSITPVVQRESGEEEEVQMKSEVQRASDGSSVASGSVESQLAGSKGGGSALPNDVRSYMEPRFGADFSSVRVHTDSNAVQMNKELGAQAFAHGSDIYYGAGKSPGKDELTAHELTHTIQQGGAVRANTFSNQQQKENKLQTKVDFTEPTVQLQEKDEQNTDADIFKKLVQDLGTEVTANLSGSMDKTTFHMLSLKDSIAKVGIDDFIALVQRDGADAMIRYGAEALQKVGKADLDKAASIIATILSPSKLQKKWKHAVDFGVTSQWKASDQAAHTNFQAALNNVIANADVVFVGPYHGSNWAAHFFKGDKVVITELSQDFISGWANASNKLAGIKTAAPPLGSNNFRVR